MDQRNDDRTHRSAQRGHLRGTPAPGEDWKRGYDETVREGPPLAGASVATGDYEPYSDNLAPAGVRGYGGPDWSEHWPQGGYDAQGGGYGGPNAPPPRTDEAPHGAYYGVRSGNTGGSAGYDRRGGWGHGTESAHVQRRRAPKNYKRSDERIREHLCEQLIGNGNIDAGDVEVNVRDGVVTLEGTVPKRGMKHMIEDMAAACAGVADVENRVRVSGALEPQAEALGGWGSGAQR